MSGLAGSSPGFGSPVGFSAGSLSVGFSDVPSPGGFFSIASVSSPGVFSPVAPGRVSSVPVFDPSSGSPVFTSSADCSTPGVGFLSPAFCSFEAASSEGSAAFVGGSSPTPAGLSLTSLPFCLSGVFASLTPSRSPEPLFFSGLSSLFGLDLFPSLLVPGSRSFLSSDPVRRSSFFESLPLDLSSEFLPSRFARSIIFCNALSSSVRRSC